MENAYRHSPTCPRMGTNCTKALPPPNHVGEASVSEGRAPLLREGTFTEPYVLEEFLCHDAGPGIDRELHLTDLLVDLFHEMDHEIHKLVLVHLLRVEVSD